MDSHHLVELETKILHQEMAIEELQQAAYQQHLAIEKLEKNLKLLTDRFDGSASGPDIRSSNEKPPHY